MQRYGVVQVANKQELMAQYKEAPAFWKEMMEEIGALWMKKKGQKYYFSGQDLKLLKGLVSSYGVPRVMSMFSLYLRGGTYFGPRTGFLISGMVQDRGVLIDHAEFNSLSKKYEGQLEDLDKQSKFDDFLGGEHVPKRTIG